ncbi:MAG: protease modulator HflC [Gammaproteobacteria bacterium]|nr:protease modulator HflC [Gammaproteobacteria bacterium]
MKSKTLIVLIALLAILASFSLFTVSEKERAIKFQLGKIVRADYGPGLHFKVPIFQDVRKFDARIQTLDAPAELYLTSEKKNVRVDSYVKWRIADVERYYTATGGNASRASSRLHAINQKDLKDAFGKRTIREVVAEERAEIMAQLTLSLNESAAQFGMEVVDVRVKRIDLPQNVSQSVFQRMQAERKEVAQTFRSRGEEESKKIRAIAEREVAVILAEANRDFERLRGDGDGRAAEIYAKAYSQDAEFYALYRSLQAYASTFNSKSDVLLLQPDAEFFKYFKNPNGKE